MVSSDGVHGPHRPPISLSDPVPADVHREIRERAIFDYYKLDQQVGDVPTCFPRVIKITASAWHEISVLAEQLSKELVEAERTLLKHVDLHKNLGFSWSVRRALRKANKTGSQMSGPRLTRFDFHWTSEGFRISEANTDVPGGLNETSCYARLFAHHIPDCLPAPDVTEIYASKLLEGSGPAPRIGLLHATAYADDHQVMLYLASRLRIRGAIPYLLSPDALRWSRDNKATALTPEGAVSLSSIVRFFPGEWLPNLPDRCGWPMFFSESRIPLSNPAIALLTQSKRFPLIWDALDVPLPTWRRMLPETRDPRELKKDVSPSDWVYKPALGRVGEYVGIQEACSRSEWDGIQKAVRRHPGAWVAQKRFESVPILADGVAWHACIGVYTIENRVAGAYGRISDRPRIDQYARDAAVMIQRGE